jgi:DNA modification methylase
MAERKRGTSTSNFGVGKRESHDASAFYARFEAPRIERGGEPQRPIEVDRIVHGSAVDMEHVADDSVALVVTSPPYFAGKAYEEALGEGHIPASYVEYLANLHAVFLECARVLEPGGRIAVNVANLGRKPYRSLSADVIGILQDELGLLLRGEIIWQKARGAGGSCAWGSFQSAANPVLRDLTERVIVASKGQFERALSPRQRRERDLPLTNTLFKDEFMEATTDLWEIPAESATRVGHPAPFPVVLPRRLIELYTFKGDLVLDPFMGSGTTAIAALRTERHYFGYETDADYLAAAEARLVTERDRIAATANRRLPRVLRAGDLAPPDDEDFQQRAVREGKKAKDLAHELLFDICGFTLVAEGKRLSGGVEVNFVAKDAAGHEWLFDVSGAFTTTRPGLRRSDTLWKALGKAAVIKASGDARRLVFLTTDLPLPGTPGHQALRTAHEGGVFFDALEMLDADHSERLLRYAKGDQEPGEAALPLLPSSSPGD